MNRGVLLIALLVFLAAGAAGVYLLKPEPRPPAPAAEATPAPTPDTPPAPPKPSPAPARSAATPSPEPKAAEPEPAPTKGTLIVESDVPETSVFIDRVYLGNAPVTVRDLTPGPHRLNMSVTGYDGVSETIDVEPGTRTISMKFKEIRLDEKIDVTHKHTFGSCSGTLRASPQRLVYDTTNTGDAFSVALTNLETFDMDYVQKTLKVKVRDGKTYNFTAADGNVDALYLFHQTVDKVRQRLLSGRRP